MGAGCRNQPRTRRPLEAEGIGEQAHRLQAGSVDDAAFHIAEPAHADAGALGQLLLGQGRSHAQLP
jgi:hypothetical protein